MWAHDKELNITCHQLNGSVFQRNHTELLLLIFLLIKWIFKSAGTKTLHLQQNSDSSFAGKFSIAISDKSALWVTAGSWGVFRKSWFSRHWRGNLSKARFIFAVNWQRRISRTPYAYLGGTLSQGAKIQLRRQLAPKESFDPQIVIWSTWNLWSWGPFQRKVLIHYSYLGPLWKQGI